MVEKLNNLILVPTDFSETCQNAIDYAVKLAETAGFEVHILHVINRETKSKLGKDAESLVVRKLQEIVDQIHKDTPVTAKFLYREGSIFDIISEVSEELGANLLILGTHGKKGLQYLFGSYAMKVISQSSVPVGVVQKKKFPEHGFRKIVFPVGFYTEARQQVRYVVNFPGKQDIEVLIFQQSSSDPGESAKVNIVTGQIEEEFKRNNVRYSLHQAERFAGFAEQLIDFAVANNADIIFMMTDSNIDQPDFNNSSWSETLIFNEAQIPVLCINPVYLGQIYYAF
jgi:nucleotide-binding universal stress UspA family protein